MARNSKTPLDLELNLFENSFASKDLLHTHGAKKSTDTTSPVPDASSRSTAASSVSHNSSASSSEMLEIKPRSSATSANVNVNDNGTANPENEADGPETSGSAGGNNKHNLRLSNFNSVSSERLPGLTPAIFTPGGRRLPPIHLSPGLGASSPGTPGSNLWSSLLTATNGAGAGQNTEQHPGMYQPGTYPSYLRKSGLIPTESHLRSGLTPGIMGPNGFNFNLPDGMANGQMTPGLQTLLGLVNTQTPLDQQGMPGPGAGAVPNQEVDPAANPPAPLSGPNLPEPIKEPIKEEMTSPAPAKPSKNPKKRKGDAPKKAQKAAKTSSAAKPEDPSEKTDANDNDENLDEEEKRKQFLERNRVAALKCRQRKKQLLSKMESELAFYSDGYRDLTAQNSSLREQLMVLRGIIINHKDCPALSNSVGGYQQLQNIVGQSDFVAHGTAGRDPGFVPTTVAPLLETPHLDAPNGKPPSEMNQNHNVQAEQGPNGMTPSNSVHDMHVLGGHTLGGHTLGGHALGGQGVPHAGNMVHTNRGQIPYDEELAMGREYGQGIGNYGNVEASKDSLRSISSTSNLQHAKQNAHANGYDLRPIASMADLHHQHQHQAQNPGIMPRQFQL